MIMRMKDLRGLELYTHAAEIQSWMNDVMGTLWEHVTQLEIDDDGYVYATLVVTPLVESQHPNAVGKEFFVWNLGNEERPPYWVEGGVIHAWS